MPDRYVVYVDGFNLYHGLHDRSQRKKLWLDLEALARALRPASQLVRVRYFTADVLDDPAALSRQTTYLDALLAQSGNTIDIVRGRYQRKEFKCFNCGRLRIRYEEKETDVNIATAILEDAAGQTVDSALLISADSDIVPAVKAARRLNPNMFLAAAFPPARFSDHLKRLMPASFHIGMSKINQAQLPDVVVDPRSGRSYTRPSKWA